MKTLVYKRILLGVTGGIAAYKSADLVRRLRDQGAEVRVVMTRGACEFVTPLTFQALSGNPVGTELLDPGAEAAMGHIELSRWSDVILIAPASANFLAKLSHGLAGDLLSTLCLAADAPILVAPAMNRQMWLNPATVENMAALVRRGVVALGPGSGDQACGETGPGRMLEPAELVRGVEAQFHTGLLSGKKVLITAGPTREAIDPVRFISNRSSGRMGFAIARAAQEAGAVVTLVSGPVALEPPERIKFVAVKTAEQMLSEVMADVADADIFISAAAVADYRCSEVAENKIKKHKPEFSIKLERNPDILSRVTEMASHPFTVGFAAETESLIENARNKLEMKNMDMIAANRVGEELGFDVDENALEVYWGGGSLSLEKMPKEKLARRLLRVVAEQYYARHANRAH